MNEIELQKLLIKEAFSKKQLPHLNLIDGSANDVALIVRNYIWQSSGYLQNEKAPNGFHHSQRLQVRSKKNALVMLYKLWSGFTKNLRYLLTNKSYASVRISRFGTISRTDADEDDARLNFSFIASPELNQ